jgi:hypothetical protein
VEVSDGGWSFHFSRLTIHGSQDSIFDIRVSEQHELESSVIRLLGKCLMEDGLFTPHVSRFTKTGYWIFVYNSSKNFKAALLGY